MLKMVLGVACPGYRIDLIFEDNPLLSNIENQVANSLKCSRDLEILYLCIKKRHVVHRIAPTYFSCFFIGTFSSTICI